MAAGDPFLHDVAQRLVPLGCPDIGYRHDVLADCLHHPDAVRSLYDIAVTGCSTRPQSSYGGLTFGDPAAILRWSLDRIELLVAQLRTLRTAAIDSAKVVESAGFRRLFAMIIGQLDEPYLSRIDADIAELRFGDGITMSAVLGCGDIGADYRLHPTPAHHGHHRRTGFGGSGIGFRVPESDDAGFRALGRLTGRAIGDIADIMSQAADDIEHLFIQLRTELGFYIGCLNLHDRLTDAGLPVCRPEPWEGTTGFTCRGLRDIGLCLTAATPVVGNDIDARDISLTLITGANAGGKSTFLRGVGTARVMMAAGMFVVAESFGAARRDAVFTHFAREENDTLTRGKLDEELARMRDIVDRITPHSLLLCNESFAATNEREGTQIAEQVLDALGEAGVEIIFVTHLYELAHRRYRRRHAGDLFLSAQRTSDGTRTYRLAPAEPEPTSHGRDSYRRIFGPPHQEIGGRV